MKIEATSDPTKVAIVLPDIRDPSPKKEKVIVIYSGHLIEDKGDIL